VSKPDDLSETDAVRIVARSVRRLFSIVSEPQARDLASTVLRDLRKQGIRLVQDSNPSGAE
jgi:hypothetical protein